LSQLRFFQFTTVFLVLLLVGGVAYYEYRQHALQPVTIVVNGNPVTTVESISAAQNLITQVHALAVGSVYLAHDNPRFVEDVEFLKAPNQTLIDSSDAAAAKLSAATHTVVDADAIVVNQKPIVALPDAQTAQQAVDELRNHYVSLPPSGPLMEKPSFVQTVTIDRRTVPAALTKTNADDAAAVLWTPPPPQTYQVQSRDTGWSISQKFHLSFSDFLRANAAINVNRLAPGDTVIVSKTFPPVDVIVKKQLEEEQTFGGSGERQITEEATFIDGVLTGTPIALNIVTLKRATPGNFLD